MNNEVNNNQVANSTPNVITNNINSNQNNSLANNHTNKSYSKLILFGLISFFVVIVGVIIIILLNKKPNFSRTFMIYMVGADLESKNALATSELDGIDPTLVDLENINVVLIAGGALRWKNDYIDASETSIYELTPDGFTKVKEQEIQNMGKDTTLANFINYVYDNYKTDKYELLFWNHGGALLGSEFDEISNNDNLSLEEITNVLSTSPFNKKNKIETIIFSTCLNGTIENANIFKDYADYFVASEEVSMGVFNTSDFKFINEVTVEDNGYDIGIKFIQKYKEKMLYLKEKYEILNSDYNIYSTYSIINLNKIDNLNKAVDEFFEDIDLAKNYNKISKVRSNLHQYAYNQSGDPNYDMVDLYNLIYELKDLSPKKADKALKKLEETILYNYSTNSFSRGLSIYFPYNGSAIAQKTFLSIYESIDYLEHYNKFINEFGSLKTLNAQTKLSFEKNETEVKTDNKEADFVLKLTDDQAKNYAKAQYIVFRDNKDGYYLPVYNGSEVKLENNTLKAKIKDRQLKVLSKSGKLENIITLLEQEVTDSYIRYSTAVILENFSSKDISDFKIDNATMSLLLDKKTNKIGISGILLKNKNDLPDSVLVNLKDYTTVAFASSSFKILDEKGNYVEDWESNGTLKGVEISVGDFEFELQNYDDGYDYYCVFRIYDVNNNYYYSKLIKMN